MLAFIPVVRRSKERLFDKINSLVTYVPLCMFITVLSSLVGVTFCVCGVCGEGARHTAYTVVSSCNMNF